MDPAAPNPRFFGFIAIGDSPEVVNALELKEGEKSSAPFSWAIRKSSPTAH